MFHIGVAIEKWDSQRRNTVLLWLNSNFSEFKDYKYIIDYDLETIYMTEEVYILFSLKFGD
jgi:hypothetical protein